MFRAFYLAYAGLCYAIFFATFLYLIAFFGNFPFAGPKVDFAREAEPAVAIAIDLALIALFGVQHSVMARPGFKAAWTRIVPAPVERSTYVLLASAALIVLMLFWHELTAAVWTVTDPVGAAILWALFGLGWLIVLTSTFLINHFELFGLQQAWFALREKAAAPPVLRQPFFYRFVRHPLYAGFFIAFWATPAMTAGHLLLAAGLSAYMLIAIRLEERDLIDVFGEAYVSYRRRVGMLIPHVGDR
ncbi:MULTISPECIES: methanethiol S-methyltransferase [Sphingopyxis]|uniref:methanethiol S-methyltransferase n=1 Tax=Sphingopyxis TaxID=165697 RepID=UPI0015C6E2F1|nr:MULTISPECIES: methanethiol S-methyltransferase [Sphingopyxis]NYF31497.1 protein-S-isoprenylcysteine O-methyltransferase Ste14 [Sphingopyxis sp. JAI108]